jgi:hypothetical protein
LSELEKISKTLGEIRDHLNEHLDRDSKLLVRLCGDQRMERQIEETNEVGATLTDEQLAYQRGILASIIDKLDTINNAVWRMVK